MGPGFFNQLKSLLVPMGYELAWNWAVKIKGMSINSTLYLSCQGVLMLFPLSLK